MLYQMLRPLLFRLAPERAHHLTVNLLQTALRVPGVPGLFKQWYGTEQFQLARRCFGLDFPNPIGLAAGFDKDGQYMHAMRHLGFGFLEIGTVTPRPQPGNPQPRLFRLPQDKALINRMGFNNEGVDALAQRLAHNKPEGIIIGGNIGKNKDTPNENAVQDYLYCYDKLVPYVDYFVVNVSSPNTPNLRALQDREPLTQLLHTLQERNQNEATPKPILLKIAPDLGNAQLDDIIAIARETQLAGLIATNTTISRDGLTTPAATIENIGAGGLSGTPLRQRATEVVRYLHTQSQGQIPIIGVGGIGSPQDALEKLDAGACLVQVYSGMVYYGPTIARDCCTLLEKKGN